MIDDADYKVRIASLERMFEQSQGTLIESSKRTHQDIKELTTRLNSYLEANAKYESKLVRYVEQYCDKNCVTTEGVNALILASRKERTSYNFKQLGLLIGVITIITSIAATVVDYRAHKPMPATIKTHKER